MPRDALLDHCLELLVPVGRPRARRMFGGHGLYVDELFIALIAFDRLFLKVDDQTRQRFEGAGSEPFSYPKADGVAVMNGYWSAPEEAMDSPGAMEPWARLAMAAALRAQAAKAKSPLTKRSAPSKRPAPAAAPATSGAARQKASARAKR